MAGFLQYVKVIFFIPSLKHVEAMFYIPWVVKLLEAAQPEPQMYVMALMLFYVVRVSLRAVRASCCRQSALNSRIHIKAQP